MNININKNQESNSASIATASKDISAKQTLRLILQFLKEQNLTNSFHCLQQESGVLLSAIENVETFVADVASGNIQRLADVCSFTKLPCDIIFEVFDHVCCEIIDSNNKAAFDTFFGESSFNQALDGLSTEKKARLSHLKLAGSRIGVEPQDIWDGHPNQRIRQRKQIARSVAQFLEPMPPNQLIKLLTRTSDSTYTRLSPSVTDLPSVPRTPLEYEDGRLLTCVAILEDNSRLCSGFASGDLVISDWRVPTATVCHLKVDNMSTATCMTLSADDQVLASGDICGSVYLWQLSKSKLGVKLKNIHTGSVQSIDFHCSEPSVLTAATDNTVKLTKITSGATTMNIPSASPDTPVRQAFFDPKCKRIVTCSSDGVLRFYSTKTGVLQKTRKIDIEGIVIKYRKSMDSILMYTESQACVVDFFGIVTGRFSTANENHKIRDVVFGPQKSLVILDTTHKLIMFDILDARMIQELSIPDDIDKIEIDKVGRNIALWAQDSRKIQFMSSGV